MARIGRTWMSVVALGGLLLAGSALTTSASAPSASSFVPMAPCRLFDTRAGSDNIGPRSAPIGANETYTTPVWGTNGNCTIPSGATGISLNVAIINPTGASFLTVFPGQTERPLAASLNWVAGQAPTPNAVTASLGADGSLSFYNLNGTVDLAVDVVGYYELAGQASTPGPRPAQIVWVAKSGGDHTSVGAALAAITDASFSKRYVIRVAPGTYDEAPLSMKSYVELEGSGPASTEIRCLCPGTQLPANGSNAAAINIGAGIVTTIRDLTVESVVDLAPYAIGIRTQSTDSSQVLIENVSAAGRNASAGNYGFYLLGGATVLDSTAIATSASATPAHGVSVAGANAVLRRVKARASVGGIAVAAGVYAVSGSTTLDDSDVTGISGGGIAYGFFGSGGFATVTDSSLTGISGSSANLVNAYGAFADLNSFFTRSTLDAAVGGGSANSWGLFAVRPLTVTDSELGGAEVGIGVGSNGSIGVYQVSVSGSTVNGSVNSATTAANTQLRISNSVLGGPVSNGGTLTCTYVVDENGLAAPGGASACPL